MPIRIKNWKLAILALIFIALFSALGSWQLSRAHQKQHLINDFNARLTHKPIRQIPNNLQTDLRFYQAEVTGHFDNAQPILLDNKTLGGRAGYEVYTPFKLAHSTNAILVDRGFVAVGRDRQVVPDIKPILGNVTIRGLLNLPPTQISLGSQLFDPFKHSNILRVENLDLAQLATKLGYPLLPYTLTLPVTDKSAFTIVWQAVTIPPERHYGYAVQWFALALTLLILFVVLNRSRS